MMSAVSGLRSTRLPPYEVAKLPRCAVHKDPRAAIKGQAATHAEDVASDPPPIELDVEANAFLIPQERQYHTDSGPVLMGTHQVRALGTYPVEIVTNQGRIGHELGGRQRAHTRFEECGQKSLQDSDPRPHRRTRVWVVHCPRQMGEDSGVKVRYHRDFSFGRKAHLGLCNSRDRLDRDNLS